MPDLALPVNNLTTTVGASHTAGASTLQLAAGAGAILTAALAELGLTLGPTSPVRVTVVQAAYVGSSGQITDRSKLCVFEATGLTGDTLTGLSAVEGKTDLGFTVGDFAGFFLTAGTILDIHTALTDASRLTTGTLSSSLLAGSGVAAGTYTKATVTVDAKGRVTSAASGAVTIGDTISGGTAGDVLYVGTSGVLAQAAITGLVKWSGSGPAAATAGTDYVAPGGVSGGQTVNGGTGASEALTLVSTTHGTKGRVNVGSALAYADALGNFTATGYYLTGGGSLTVSAGTLMFNPGSADPIFMFRGSGGGNRVVQIDGISAGGSIFFCTVSGNQSVFRVEPAGQTRAIARTASISPLAVEAMTGQTAPLQSLRGISSTSALRDVAYLDAGFVVATDASRTGYVSLSAVDFAGTRQGLKVSSDGTQALIGFFGAAPVAKPTVTGSRGGNAALASVLTALANLGLITDSSSA